MSAKKYSLGIVGRKAGMSRLFTEDGKSIPVTLIEATPNRITQIKTAETDGYTAVQITAGAKRAALVNKPSAGHFAKSKVDAGRGLWEFRVASDAIRGGFDQRHRHGLAVFGEQPAHAGLATDDPQRIFLRHWFGLRSA